MYSFHTGFEIPYVVKWLHLGGLALWTQLLPNSKKPGNSCSAATGRPFGEGWGQRRGRDVKGTQCFPLLQGSGQLIPEIAQQRTCPHFLHILGSPGQSRFGGTPPLSLFVVTFHLLLIAFPHWADVFIKLSKVTRRSFSWVVTVNSKFNNVC